MAHSLEGYINVKFAESRTGSVRRVVSGGSAWLRRWVIVRADAVAEIDAVVPVAVVDIYRDKKQAAKLSVRADNHRPSHKPPSGVVRRVVGSRRSLIFRCKSRSQAYSFTIVQNNTPIIHLAGSSETESQRWMEGFRSILWPQDDIVAIEKSKQSCLSCSCTRPIN